MSDTILSVVICTYNRAELLPVIFESLANQTAPRNLYEILLVDNGSTDSTKRTAESYFVKIPNMRYEYEPEIGLSSARNHGWRQARGEYVGFLDDDCKVPADWIANALRVVQEIGPHGFGGPFYAFYNSPKPAWFKDEYGSHVQGDAPRALKENEYLDGGNMFIRCDILQSFGGFRADMGMKGREIAYGEETQFFMRLRSEMKEAVLFYDPSVFVYHLVRAEKMKLWSAPKRFFVSGMYSAKIQLVSYRLNRVDLLYRMAISCLELTLSFFRGMISRDKATYPYLQNYWYEITFQYFIQLGSLVQVFRNA
jgi:glucosyl-dolichyl phosphate glucuronosyltransferase